MAGASLSLLFETEERAALVKEQFCRGSWPCCRLARMIWAQYDELSHIEAFSGE